MANPSIQHNPTDGLGVAAFVLVSGTNVVNPSGGAGAAQGTTGFPLGQGIGAAPSVNHPNAQYMLTLSKSAATVNGVVYAATCQLSTAIVDVNKNVYPGSLVLTAAANASGGTTVYTGTITGGGSNAFAGMTVTVAGFVTTANNGTFLVTASSTTTITLANAAGVAETHAGTVNGQVGSPIYRSYGDPANKAASAPAWYNPSNFTGYDPNVASVSSTGLITSRNLGQTVVEVAFPTFDNTIGTAGNTSGNAGMAGQPINMIYVQVLVNVIA